MMRTNEEGIRKTIERNCRRELDALALEGIPTGTLLRLLAQTAMRGGERMSERTKHRLHDRRRKLKGMADQLTKLSRELRQFVESDPFEGIQKPVHEEFNAEPSVKELYKRRRIAFERLRQHAEEHPELNIEVPKRLPPWKPKTSQPQWWSITPESPVGVTLACMDSLAKALREESLALGKYIKTHGHPKAIGHIRGIEHILGWLYFCNPNFKMAALSKLLEEAFLADGIDAGHNSERLSVGALRQARDRQFRALNRLSRPAKPKETLTWQQR
jgi:hypothetical protein